MRMGAVLWNCLSLILPPSLAAGGDNECNEIGFLLEVSQSWACEQYRFWSGFFLVELLFN